MSKKGGGGGSVSGRGGGTSRTTPTPRNIPGGPNGGRYSHFKTLETDAKYGMLMWQSKLQEKLVKEVSESKFTKKIQLGQSILLLNKSIFFISLKIEYSHKIV